MTKAKILADIRFGLFCWLMHVAFLPLTMAIREAVQGAMA